MSRGPVGHPVSTAPRGRAVDSCPPARSDRLPRTIGNGGQPGHGETPGRLTAEAVGTGSVGQSVPNSVCRSGRPPVGGQSSVCRSGRPPVGGQSSVCRSGRPPVGGQSRAPYRATLPTLKRDRAPENGFLTPTEPAPARRRHSEATNAGGRRWLRGDQRRRPSQAADAVGVGQDGPRAPPASDAADRAPRAAAPR